MIMKKYIFTTLLILAALSVRAQDTLDVDYQNYMFNDKPDSGINASVIYMYALDLGHYIIVDTLGGYGNGGYDNEDIHAGIMLQHYYAADTIKIYGVALLLGYRIYDKYGTPNIPPTRGRTRYKAMLVEGDNFIAGTSSQMYPIDSVWFDTASVIHRCRFRYDGEIPGTHKAVVPCTEFYFDTPQTMHGDFFVGRAYASGSHYDGSYRTTFYPIEHYGRYNHDWTPYNFAFQQFHSTEGWGHDTTYNYFCWWKPDEPGPNFANPAATHANLWGFCFPIIGLRCQPLHGLQVEEQGEQYVNFGWQASGEEGGEYVVSLYDTVNQAEVATDTIADTNYMFSSLTPSIYRFSVKKNCHYVTTGYDTTVWSDASTLLVTMGGYEPPVDTTAADTTIVDTTGIRLAAVGDADFSLRPNPAVAAAVVTLQYAVAEVAELQLVDLHGRTVQHHVLAAGTKQLTLDLAQLPAGAYLVKLVTPRGLSARRLVVRK